VYALSDAIRYYLIEANPPVPYLYAYLELLPAEAELEQFFIAQELKQAIATFLARTQTQERAADRFLVNLCSGDQSLLRRLTGTLARQLGMNCYQLNCSRLAEAVGRKNEADILRELPHMVRSCCRDLRLNNAALALSNTRMLSAELLHQLIKTAADILGVRYFFVLNGMARDLSRCLPTGSEQGWFLVDLHLSPPDTALREQIWLHAAQKNGIELGAEQAATLAANFTLTEEHISFALRDAVGIQLTRPAAELELASLAEACRAQTHRELQGIAQRLLTNHKLEDIVLFEETRSQVEEVLHHAQYRNKLMEDWGYAARTAASKNLSVLFHGPPGTGKTMAASACANALNLEIYRIDLATLLNKYIGETEKNLARLFDTAEAMNIILFFDEAEGLFSKRTEAQDSHDRFSNLQTGYILQRIETYNGIILLATNLLKNIDSAFVRRFKYMVEFPAPGPAQRLRMWQTAFPPALQLSPDIDFAFLADKVKLTGGGILNVSIAAALRAYNSGGLVGLEDILHAVEREYKKMGKVYDPFDFAVEQD
jgi:AAA+ superfamily predicted ATPase